MPDAFTVQVPSGEGDQTREVLVKVGNITFNVNLELFLLYSFVPSFSMLHAEKHFSACNIEKLGGPGTRLVFATIVHINCICPY